MLTTTLRPGLYLRLEGPGGDVAHVRFWDVPAAAGSWTRIVSHQGVVAARVDRNAEQHPEAVRHGSISLVLDIDAGWDAWKKGVGYLGRRGVSGAA